MGERYNNIDTINEDLKKRRLDEEAALNGDPTIQTPSPAPSPFPTLAPIASPAPTIQPQATPTPLQQLILKQMIQRGTLGPSR